MAYSEKIDKAIRAATTLHDGHIRRGRFSYPYVTHLISVAFIVSSYTDDEDCIAAAFLHDTLEDTEYTPEDMFDDFGEQVTEIVLGVSEYYGTQSARPDWTSRKQEYIKQLNNAPNGSLIVSAADKIHNFSCILDEYVGRPNAFIRDFGTNLLQRLNHYQEVSNVINRRLQNPIVPAFNETFAKYRAFLADVQRYIEGKGV